MPRWLLAGVAVATFLASWRWIVRPLHKAYDALMALLRQIRDASGGVAKLTAEVQALSGAIVRLVLTIVSTQEDLRVDLDAVRDQVSTMSQLVVDLDADLRRLERSHRQGGPDDETPTPT